MTETNTLSPIPAAPPSRWPSLVLVSGIGAAFLGVGLAAGLMLRGPVEPSAPATAPVNSSVPADTATQLLTATPPSQPPVMVSQQNAPRHETPVQVAPAPKATAPRNTAARAAEPRQQVAVCSTCGVIESVKPVTRKGEGTGLGAVAGGVVGGVVGNQMGGGNGKKAMTVLGAIGGGFAGNEIEKRARSETVYEVRVRMDDGSYRTFTRNTAPAAGARVTVEGQTFRTTNSGNPNVMHTSGQTPG